MHTNKENIDKEILRILQLSGYRNVSKSNTTESKGVQKKLIKEDFIDDLNDVFNTDQEFNDLTTSGTKAILTPEMKLAMVSLSISEYEKGLLDLYNTYNPKSFTNKIPGARVNKDDDSTLVNKPTSYKPTNNAQDDLKRWKDSQKNQFPLNNKKNLQNFDKAIEDLDKTIRIASVYLDPNFTEEDIKNMTKKQVGTLSKFFGKKSINMISYNGHQLTPLGKSQIEFLARAGTLKASDDFEEKLFNLTSKMVYKENARSILRSFYTLASIPIVNNLLHRSKINYDNQIKEWIEAGLDRVMDKMDSFYDHTKSNFGAWALQVIKHAVINKLRDVSIFKLNTEFAHNYLMNEPLPIKIQSTAIPKETEGSWDRYIEIKDPNHINYPNGKGNVERSNKYFKTVYEYIYDDPNDAYYDLIKDARIEGGKPSPLSPRFLTGISKSKLMHAVHPALVSKPLNHTLDTTSENPYETQSIFKVETLPQEAKQIIFEILKQIEDVIISDLGKHKDGEDYASDYNYVSKNVVPLLKSNKKLFLELMYDLLSFGDMAKVYTKTWVYKNSKGGTTTRQPGDPVVTEKNENGDEIEIENVDNETPDETNTTTVWSSGSLSEEKVKEQFLQKFIARIQNTTQDSDPNTSELFNLFKTKPKEANAIISAIRGGLRKFFGYEGVGIPALQKNRNKLNQIISNYDNSMLNENTLRQIVKNSLLNYINQNAK